MKEIILTKGKVALVDDEDYEWLNMWKWQVRSDLKHNLHYASTSTPDGCRVYMHRLLMMHPDGLVVDHIDHDGLNNQKKNLKTCTHRVNMCNRKKHPASVYPGVSKVNNKWKASIWISGRKVHLGVYKNEELAYASYCDALNRYENNCLITIKHPRNRTSQYKGVSFNKRNGNWYSQLQRNKKKYYLGEFSSEKDAADAYQKKRLEIENFEF